MEKITEFFTGKIAEYSTMKFLIAEILLCLLAASILGLIIGWLCKAAFAREKLNLREDAWNKKLRESDDRHQGEITEAQRQNEELSNRISSVNNQNQTLTSSLEANKSAVHKAHIEVQQLNKKQKDSHERLQKMIAEKDREISKLQRETRKGKDSPPKPFGVSSTKPKSDTSPLKTAPSPNNAQSSVGGKPNASSQRTADAGFKPGTQANPEFNAPSSSTPKAPPGTRVRNGDLDKTQVIKDEKAPSQQSYSDPLRDSNPARESTSSQAAGDKVQSRVPNDSRSTADSRTPSDTTRRSTQGPSDNDRHDQTLDSTLDSTSSFTQQATSSLDDTTSSATTSTGQQDSSGSKKSLWERVKSSVTKSVDKTKL